MNRVSCIVVKRLSYILYYVPDYIFKTQVGNYLIFINFKDASVEHLDYNIFPY